ncbi:MAG: M20/M25/M40 family metallo-hydrolase [Thermoleophilia bacterium]|nr:M20/M25/M40 family metallo-hydrolase [Thermoleophilia bacterium]
MFRPPVPRPEHAGLSRLGLACLLAAMLSSRPARCAEGLDAKETKIVEAARALTGEAEVLLERAVNIPSATQNVAGVRAVGKLFEDELKPLGFATRWDELPPTLQRAGHLIAERAGDRGPRILIIGHLDTVLEGTPFRKEGRRATGPGTSDMKGGDVIVVMALKALHRAGRLDGARVALIFTGDEESPGDPVSISRASMIELAKRSDIALAFEAAIDDTATIARRGVSTWTLRVSSPTGHSAGIFGDRLGPGAVFEGARILDGFRKALGDEKGLTFNPSLILGGTEVDHADGTYAGRASGKDNVVAGTLVVNGDLRFLSNAQRDAAQAKMRAIVAEGLPRSKGQIVFRDEYPAMAPTPENLGVLGVLDRASRDLGLGPIRALDPAERGAGDISFIAPLLRGLDGLGAKGGGAHAPGEYIDLDSLGPQIVRAALLIDRLSHDGEGQKGPAKEAHAESP